MGDETDRSTRDLGSGYRHDCRGVEHLQGLHQARPSEGQRWISSYNSTGQDVFLFHVTNLTAYGIRVTNCAGASEPIPRRRWMRRRRLRRVFPDKGQHYIFAMVTEGGQNLPISVEPKDSTMIACSINPDEFPKVGDLYVSTSDGKEWFCPRKDIEAIHRGEVYKALQSKQYLPTPTP
jgi:hypothetical protein